MTPPVVASSGSPIPVHPSVWRGDLLAASLVLLWLLLVRAALDCPWGFAPVAAPDGLHVGIPFNVGDTWSYLSWAQQYHEGHFAASLLYTTAPHATLLWIFPLWLDARLAALTGLPLLGVYSLLGALGAAAATVCFRRAGRALGLARSTVDWATVVFVLGSGASWVWHAAHRAGLAPAMAGAEFLYTDLFPSTAFLVHPYHAQSFALLAALWWAVAVAERRLTEQRPALTPLAAAAALAVLLTFSRPYEPLVFAAAYALKTLWSFLTRHRDATAWRASRTVLLVLAVALAPGVLWSFYISLQPAWSAFARRSLAQGFPRVGWLSAFAGLWLLVAFGARHLLRLPHLRGALPLLASVLGAALLLIVPQAPAKLASGLAVGLALVAGAGVSQLLDWLRARRSLRLTLPLGAFALAGLVGTPSLAMGLLEIRLAAQAAVDPSLDALARALPLRTAGHRTVVLTDADTGNVLPGLCGLRVYAGHFALTPDFEVKRDQLRRAGLDPAHLPGDAASLPVALGGLLALVSPDYALLDARCTGAADTLLRRGWRRVAAAPRWLLLGAPASVLGSS